jgi:acetyl/propionyl-CoA carboxylase alpha subunit
MSIELMLNAANLTFIAGSRMHSTAEQVNLLGPVFAIFVILVAAVEAPEGPGVRVDSGVVSGDVISTHYDPLLAKIIVHAPDRPSAIRRMQAALRETVALGVRTNLDFLQDVLAHPVFTAGEATTRFIETYLAGWMPEADVPLEVLAAAGMIEDRKLKIEDRGDDGYSPWKALAGFRVGGGV